MPSNEPQRHSRNDIQRHLKLAEDVLMNFSSFSLLLEARMLSGAPPIRISTPHRTTRLGDNGCLDFSPCHPTFRNTFSGLLYLLHVKGLSPSCQGFLFVFRKVSPTSLPPSPGFQTQIKYLAILQTKEADKI